VSGSAACNDAGACTGGKIVIKLSNKRRTVCGYPQLAEKKSVPVSKTVTLPPTPSPTPAVCDYLRLTLGHVDPIQATQFHTASSCFGDFRQTAQWFGKRLAYSMNQVKNCGSPSPRTIYLYFLPNQHQWVIGGTIGNSIDYVLFAKSNSTAPYEIHGDVWALSGGLTAATVAVTCRDKAIAAETKLDDQYTMSPTPHPSPHHNSAAAVTAAVIPTTAASFTRNPTKDVLTLEFKVHLTNESIASFDEHMRAAFTLAMATVLRLRATDVRALDVKPDHAGIVVGVQVLISAAVCAAQGIVRCDPQVPILSIADEISGFGFMEKLISNLVSSQIKASAATMSFSHVQTHWYARTWNRHIVSTIRRKVAMQQQKEKAEALAAQSQPQTATTQPPHQAQSQTATLALLFGGFGSVAAAALFLGLFIRDRLANNEYKQIPSATALGSVTWTSEDGSFIVENNPRPASAAPVVQQSSDVEA
jgi:hypothetical protein